MNVAGCNDFSLQQVRKAEQMWNMLQNGSEKLFA
jgi:hypothetical protein